MSTVNKLFPEPNALRLETSVNDLIRALNLQRMAILNRYHVSEMEVEIIRYLMENDMQKMKQVGEYFNIKLSTLTSTIDKLEKNKLVKRKNSKEDRRVIYIRPTAKGQNLLDDLTGATRDVSEYVTSKTKPHDFAALIKGFESMLSAIKR